MRSLLVVVPMLLAACMSGGPDPIYKRPGCNFNDEFTVCGQALDLCAGTDHKKGAEFSGCWNDYADCRETAFDHAIQCFELFACDPSWYQCFSACDYAVQTCRGSDMPQIECANKETSCAAKCSGPTMCGAQQ